MKNNIFTIVDTINNNSLLQLNKVIINDSYRKKWNVHENNFLTIVKNGEILKPILYRIGGINSFNLNTDKYFMLIKYKEAHYSKEIMKMSKSKDSKHLEGHWCIFDNEGNELIELSQFTHPYLLNNSCLYSVNNRYFNIETGESYGECYDSMSSKEYLFLDNSFDKEKSKQGILKIKKIDGSYELFPNN